MNIEQINKLNINKIIFNLNIKGTLTNTIKLIKIFKLKTNNCFTKYNINSNILINNNTQCNKQ